MSVFLTDKGYNMTDVTGNISANARVNVKKSGTSIGTRRSINYIEGANISMSITDDPTNEKVDITVNGTGTGANKPASTVVSETSFGQVPVVGVSTNYAREDHTHGSPINPVPAHAGLNGNTHGVSSAGFEDKVNKGQANGYPSLDVNGKVPATQLGTGNPDNTVFLRGDQTWAVSSGSSNIQPSNTVVSETNFGQSPSSGISNFYSRGDHTHGTPQAPTGSIPANTVKSETTYGISPSVGTSINYAREDHTHGSPPSSGGGVTIPITASYIITIDNTSTLKAINGLNGSTVFSGTDAATVINNTIGALKNTIGGLIYLKEGTYILSNPIVLYPKISLMGAGRGTVLKRPANKALKMIKFGTYFGAPPNDGWEVTYFGGGGPADYFNNSNGLTISNIYIDGNARNGGSDWAIYLGETQRAIPDFAKFENIDIYDSDGIGFNRGCYWNQFHKVNIWYAPNIAIDMSIGNDYPNANWWYDCRFTGGTTSIPEPYGTGVITHGASNNFVNCDFSGFNIAYQGSGYEDALINCYFELNNTIIDATNLYQLTVINPVLNGGNIKEGQQVIYMGSKSWRYPATAFNILDPMIRSNILEAKGRISVGDYTTEPTRQLQLSQDSAAKPGTNTWTIASDARLKEDTRAFTDGLSVIDKINPVWYKFNGKAGFNKDGKDYIGVVGQEIEKIAPYTTGKYKGKLDENDKEETELYDFNSHALTFVLINAIKELNLKIEKLSQK